MQCRGDRQGQYRHLFCFSLYTAVSLHIKIFLKHNLYLMDSFWKFWSWHQHSWISDKQEDLEKYKLGYCNVFENMSHTNGKWSICVWTRRRWVLWFSDLFPLRKMTQGTTRMRYLMKINCTQRVNSIEIGTFPYNKYSRI